MKKRPRALLAEILASSPKFTLLLFIACCAAGMARSQAPATNPSTTPAPESFGAAVERLLSVNDTGADIIPALANEVKIKNAGGDDTQSMIDLAKALLAGPSPLAIANKLASISDIDGLPDDQRKQWTGGQPEDWNPCADNFWKVAVSLKNEDAARASEYAKASFILCVACDVGYSWMRLERMTHDATAQTVLGLPQPQFDALRKIIEDRIDQSRVYVMEMITGQELIDSVTTAPTDVVDIGVVKNALSHLDIAFRQSSAQLENRWELLNTTWKFGNLLKQRHSAEGVAAVRSQLESWKRDFVGEPDVVRWVNQALTRDGPAPDKLVTMTLTVATPPSTRPSDLP